MVTLPGAYDDDVRRIVTGNDENDHAIVVADEEVASQPLAGAPDANATFFHLWTTYEMPVDLSDEALASQQAATDELVVGSGAGTTIRVGVLPPGSSSPMHRTPSLDYGICLEGECEMELDGGESVTIRAGDLVVQRGTNHAWHNRSGAPCRFAWILLDGRA
jgi:quercetin dioxygenase-like cupin family protein